MRFLHHGKIGAQSGVIHLVEAQTAHCRHQLAHRVVARRKSKAFTDGDPDRRCDLGDHPLARVLKGLPDLADVIAQGDRAVGQTAAHWPQLTHLVSAMLRLKAGMTRSLEPR